MLESFYTTILLSLLTNATVITSFLTNSTPIKKYYLEPWKWFLQLFMMTAGTWKNGKRAFWVTQADSNLI